MEAEGWLYDGESAVRFEARVSVEGGNLRIDLDDGRSLSVAETELVHLESRRDCELYGRPDVQGWRLALCGAARLGPAVSTTTGYGRWIDRIGLWKAVAVG